VRRSDRIGFVDRAFVLLFLSPLRCRKCRLRFYRPWYVARRALPVLEKQDAIPALVPLANPIPVPQRILLLDDDPALRNLLRRLLDREGYHVRECSDWGAALAELSGVKTDLAVVNLSAREEGEEAVFALRSAHPELTILVLSGPEGLLEPSEKLLILPRASRAFTVASFIVQSLDEAAARAESCRA
jgi:CheY-like chemotaxis protein